MPKFREYQNIEIPQECQIPTWSDASWHNDACARAERPLFIGQAGEWPKYRLWVEADEVIEREFDDSTKYDLQLVLSEEDENRGTVIGLYQGEDFGEVRRILEALTPAKS
jgi:hypothetical protein